MALLLLPFLAQAQTPPTPTYTAVIFAPQGGTPSPAAEGKCWTQTDGLHCYYSGAPHGPFSTSSGLVVGSTAITSGTSGRVLYDNAGVLGEYTATQLTAQINAFSSGLSGAAPASGGGSTNFLRADGTWATPPGTVTPGGSSGNVQYNNAGAFGGYTDTQLTTHINAFSSTLSGAAPASGGGSSNFLRADGTWAVPPGTSTGTVSTTGTPANGNLTKFTGAATISNGDLAGDATTSGTLTVTVGKVNGVTFGASPSTNTVPVVTGANTVTYEAVPNAALANSSMTIAGHSVALGGTQTIACGDLSNGATGCSTATGTSGATIPLLNGANTWSGVQSINSGDLALKGATSGTITLNAAATAGTTTITLPGGTTDFSATGGSNQVVKQTSSGGAFTVGTLACANLSDGATGCSTATGTSGATIPLLNGTNTWSGAQSFNDGDLKLNGSSSGNTTVKAASAAGTTTATLPNNTGTIAELNLAQTWSASQAGSITTLSISTATFTPDASNNHYYILLVHASCPCTLANPSPSFTAGTTGIIEIQQSATGSDTIGTWGTSYLAPSGTSSIVLSTSANAIDVLAYYAIDSTHILLIPSYNFSH